MIDFGDHASYTNTAQRLNISLIIFIYLHIYLGFCSTLLGNYMECILDKFKAINASNY